MAAIVILSGCGTGAPSSKIVKLDANGVVLISNNAEISSSVFRAGPSNNYYCATNAPDSTFSTAKSNGLTLTLVNFGDTVERESSSSASVGEEMLGRTPAVLALRDIMYRVCELIGNLNLTPQQALSVYMTSLQTAAALVAAETTSTTVALSSNLGIQITETSAAPFISHVASDGPSIDTDEEPSIDED